MRYVRPGKHKEVMRKERPVTTTMLKLRDYQRDAIDAVSTAWNGGMQRPAVVLSTGSGKTVIFSHMAAEFVARTDKRVVVLVHRDELADQTINKMHDVAPLLSVGKVKATSNEVDRQVVVASVQTLAHAKRMAQLLEAPGEVGLVIVDECHHAAAPTYKKIMKAFGLFTGRVDGTVAVGFTATLARGDRKGLGDVWEDVAYTKSMGYMFTKGHLVMPHAISVAVDSLDLSGVKKSGGDYQTGDLGQALEDSDAMAKVAAAYAQHAPDRKGVIFTPTVATAHQAAKEMEALGFRFAVVTGDTPKEERTQIFRDRRNGTLQGYANCMVLTEGFDDPELSCAVIARPTQSQPLYVQMVGRILRTFPGKRDALVLDVVGASRDNKLKTLIDLEEGLFQDRKPCQECERIPCTCPCEGCGGTKPCKECEPEGAGVTELVLSGTGEQVELFDLSDSAWLRTDAGVWFIPMGSSGETFLWPRVDGQWDVCVAGKDETGKALPWRKLHEALPLGTAMGWAEAEADDLGHSIATRGARWRKDKPSDAQLTTAQRLGIVTTGLRKGEVSDQISAKFASRVFDKQLKRMGLDR